MLPRSSTRMMLQRFTDMITISTTSGRTWLIYRYWSAHSQMKTCSFLPPLGTKFQLRCFYAIRMFSIPTLLFGKSYLQSNNLHSSHFYWWTQQKFIERSAEKNCFAIRMSKLFCDEVMHNQRYRCRNDYFGDVAGNKVISGEDTDVKTSFRWRYR